MPADRKREVASWGEDTAASYFAKRGQRQLARNWRQGRFAELDLVVQDQTGLVIFVEVKTRKAPLSPSGFTDSGFDAINRRKQVKMTIAARSFLARHAKATHSCRFDALIIYYHEFTNGNGIRQLEIANIHHVESAFTGTIGAF